MGLIARVLSFINTERNGAKISDVKLDPGGESNITGEHFAAPGDDSQPLPDDYAATVNIQRRGGSVPVGYLDIKNEAKAGPGEKRTYARNANGAPVSEVWQKSDGSVKISNDFGYIELKSTGNVDINGVIIDTMGNLTSPATVTALTVAASNSLTVAGVEMSDHRHPQGNDSRGDIEQDTGGPIP